jgi:hypothetical protein
LGRQEFAKAGWPQKAQEAQKGEVQFLRLFVLFAANAFVVWAWLRQRRVRPLGEKTQNLYCTFA